MSLIVDNFNDVRYHSYIIGNIVILPISWWKEIFKNNFSSSFESVQVIAESTTLSIQGSRYILIKEKIYSLSFIFLGFPSSGGRTYVTSRFPNYLWYLKIIGWGESSVRPAVLELHWRKFTLKRIGCYLVNK